MSDTRTLKEMLPEWIEAPGRHFVGWDGGWTEGVLEEFAETIVRRAAEVARSTQPPDTENEDVTWAGDCADAILVDAGLKDE